MYIPVTSVARSCLQPSDDNKRPAVAATHGTTEVDADVTQSMLAVRRLGGKYAKQRYVDRCVVHATRCELCDATNVVLCATN